MKTLEERLDYCDRQIAQAIEESGWQLFGKAEEPSYITGIQRGTQMFVEGELQHRKYERAIGKETVEWPVTEIVVNSSKKLGKAEKTESAASAASEFSERITDADAPF